MAGTLEPRTRDCNRPRYYAVRLHLDGNPPNLQRACSALVAVVVVALHQLVVGVSLP